MMKVTAVLLLAIPALVQCAQLSQAAVLDGMPAPRHRMGPPWRRMGHKRPMARMARAHTAQAHMARALANDVSSMVLPALRSAMLDRGLLKPPSTSPVEMFEHFGTRIEQVLPNLKILHDAEDLGVNWVGNVSSLMSALSDLKKVWMCYNGLRYYIDRCLQAGHALTKKSVINDFKTRAEAINMLFTRLGALAEEYEKLHPVLEEQGFMLDMMTKFFVLEAEMQKGGGSWQGVVLTTAGEILRIIGEQDAVATRANLKENMTTAVTEMESAAKEVAPVKPEGAKPTATPPAEPVEPTEPAEPAKSLYITTEWYEQDFSTYLNQRKTYEEEMVGYYTKLADWALKKDLETTWAMYDADVALYETKATPVRRHIHTILTKLTPLVFECQPNK